jgi:hypothetical protein
MISITKLHLSKYFILSVLMIFFIVDTSHGIERRRDQFPEDFGYIILPAPYSLPGIGDGVMLLGWLSNIFETHSDIGGVIFTGDVEGLFLGFLDNHFIDKMLIVDVMYGEISKASAQMYTKRGMDSDKDDFNYMDTSGVSFRGATTTLTFWERILDISYSHYQGYVQFDRIRDSDGDVIAEFDDQEFTFQSSAIEARVDYTDDFQDPTQGIRLEYSRDISKDGISEDRPDFHTVDINVTGYIPIGKVSTWAFNYYTSDAVVTREGETDPAVISGTIGIDCDAISDADDKQACETTKQERIEDTIAENKYGTASNMGGSRRLRGYPQNRFRAAHHKFYGTEFRWNMTDENTPFNLYFMQDIRTRFQLGIFYERATSAETVEELGDIWKEDYGISIRIVARSGLVFRFELAQGDEGSQFIAIFNYPWEGF